ncbi:MAG: cation:proton antiporter [Acidobacteriota bacterium]|nr:MAG: cation:proton antiporter [Acidobacteriota bacterium]
MRRVLVIGLLLGLMYVLPYLQVESDAQINPKSLASVGFILLAAFTLGELTNAIRFPRITGYIVAGVLFGPYVVNLYSTGVVEDLTLINALAIGLIALTAGGEMKIEGLRKVAKSLSLILLFKCGLILAATTVAVWLLQPMIPFLEQAALPLVLSVGFIFGVLALGTSPAVTIAVINETRSSGRLSDLLLGVAVAKDVVMVVLLALGISMANLFLTPDAVFDSSVLLKVGEELLFSIGAGCLVGGVVIAYIRFVNAEMWLFIIGLVFLSSTVASVLHLEALLMFITAGFVVQNFSKYGEKFIHPIENVALPVYVVFFSIAGAGLDLSALAQVGLVAFILVVTRLAAIYLGTRLATGLARESFEVRDNAWLGFIPQAGVVLGLSIIIAEFLSIGPQMRPIVMAGLAMNLALGPITLKMALARAGETAARDPKPESVDEPTVLAPPEEREIGVTPLDTRLVVPEYEAPRLGQLASTVRTSLVTIEQDFFDSVVVAQDAELEKFAEGTLDELRKMGREFQQQAASHPNPSAGELIAQLRNHRATLFNALAGRLISFAAKEQRLVHLSAAFDSMLTLFRKVGDTSPAKLEVPQEQARLESLPDEAASVRAIKSLKRVQNRLSLLTTSTPLQRVIRFRELCRYHFAGRLPSTVVGTANLLGSQGSFTLTRFHQIFDRIDHDIDDLLEGLSAGTFPSAQIGASVETVLRDIDTEFEAFRRDLEGRRMDLRRSLIESISLSFDGFTKHLHRAGTFELPARKYRFSKVFKSSSEARRSIEKDFERWRIGEEGLSGNSAKHLEVLGLSDRVSVEINRRLVRPLDDGWKQWNAAISAAISQCEESLASLRKQWSSKELDLELANSTVQKEQGLLTSAVGRTVRLLREAIRQQETAGVVDEIVPAFGRLTDTLAENYRVLDLKDRSRIRLDGSSPRELRLKTAPVKAVARNYLEVKVTRRLAEVDRLTLEGLEASIEALSDTDRSIRFNWKTAQEQLSGDIDSETRSRVESILEGSIERAVAQLESIHSALQELAENARTQITSLAEEEREQLEEVILESSTFDLKVQLAQEGAVGKGSATVSRVVTAARRKAAVLLRRFTPLGKEVVQDLKSTLGLSQYSPVEIVSFCDAASPERLERSELPFIYRKLFDVVPLEAEEFLIARDDELELVKNALTRWSNGMKSSVSIIGELGSGKTSFINVALDTVLSGYPCHRLNFDSTCIKERDLSQAIGRLLGSSRIENFNRLQALVEGLPGRHVVVLEDIHKLFLRSMGGFEGLRSLLLLIAKTNQKIFWVLSLRESSWRYLSTPVDLADFFTFVINMENLSKDEIESVIMTRHRLSGFDLEFLPDRYTLERRRYRRAKKSDQQAMLRKEFFGQLSKASEGNILAAIFGWLGSIGEVRGNTLEMKPFKRMNFDFLRRMDVDELLTLGMVIQHGNLSPAEHCSIFGGSAEESLSTLTCLANINLMVCTEDKAGTPHFSINKIVYKPLSRELRERNILH